VCLAEPAANTETGWLISKPGPEKDLRDAFRNAMGCIKGF
jgi:hypothetical protein